MAHANARLTPGGRTNLGPSDPDRSASDRSYRPRDGHLSGDRLPLVGRYQQLGEAGLIYRPSVPTPGPSEPGPVEQRILQLRRRDWSCPVSVDTVVRPRVLVMRAAARS